MNKDIWDALRQNDWRTVATIVILFALLYKCAGVLLKFYLLIKDSPYFKPCSVPSAECNHLLFYTCYLMSVYRQSVAKKLPALTILQQGVTGCAKIKKEEKIFQMFLLFKPLIAIYNPKNVEFVLNSTKCADKAVQYNFLHPWLGTGLLTSVGNKWHQRRKLLTPSFHFNILEEFVPVFQEQSAVLVSKLENITHEPWVDIVPLITLCTLNIICETAMGVHINAQQDSKNSYVTAIHETGYLMLYRMLRPWLYPDFIFNRTNNGKKLNFNLKLLQDFTKKVIREKKAEMLSKQADPTPPEEDDVHRRRRRAFLERLLELHLKDDSFTEDDIREEVDTFMFEGHDTTAMGISWTLYLIGLYPEVQDLIHAELDSIFQIDPNRSISREDIAEMKYLECVLKESQRLYPSVPIFGREVLESFEISGYTVHKGSVCAILPSLLHLDPDSFPEPEKFQPERFFPENCIGRHPYAYVPFSAGPRNCIGQKFAILEEKTVVANILRRFKITSLDPRDKVEVVPNLVTRNVDPLRLRFELRT